LVDLPNNSSFFKNEIFFIRNKGKKAEYLQISVESNGLDVYRFE